MAAAGDVAMAITYVCAALEATALPMVIVRTPVEDTYEAERTVVVVEVTTGDATTPVPKLGSVIETVAPAARADASLNETVSSLFVEAGALFVNEPVTEPDTIVVPELMTYVPTVVVRAP